MAVPQASAAPMEMAARVAFNQRAAPAEVTAAAAARADPLGLVRRVPAGKPAPISPQAPA